MTPVMIAGGVSEILLDEASFISIHGCMAHNSAHGEVKDAFVNLFVGVARCGP